MFLAGFNCGYHRPHIHTASSNEGKENAPTARSSRGWRRNRTGSYRPLRFTHPHGVGQKKSPARGGASLLGCHAQAYPGSLEL